MQFHSGWVGLAAVLACLLSGAAQAQDIIKIGHAAATSGAIAHLGTDNENGARMAVDELNAKGVTIGGKRYKVVLVERKTPYARCKAYVFQGLAAACFSMSWDPAFAGHIQFSRTPLFHVTPTYFRNIGRRVAATSESKLGDGISIGVVNGYEYPPSALRTRERGAVFHPARTEQANLKKLAMNRIDLALVMANDLQGINYLPAAPASRARSNRCFPATGSIRSSDSAPAIPKDSSNNEFG